MNIAENGSFATCDILTSSSADLTLLPDQTIVACYLYWAGSGTGDFDIQLNGNDISAERTFSDSLDDTRVFFAAFAVYCSVMPCMRALLCARWRSPLSNKADCSSALWCTGSIRVWIYVQTSTPISKTHTLREIYKMSTTVYSLLQQPGLFSLISLVINTSSSLKKYHSKCWKSHLRLAM